MQGVQKGPRENLSFGAKVLMLSEELWPSLCILFVWDKDAARGHLCQGRKGWPAGTLPEKCPGSRAQLCWGAAQEETDRVFVEKANTVWGWLWQQDHLWRWNSAESQSQ